MIRPLLAAALSLGSAICATAAEAGPLRAGAARVSITPTPDEFPYTVPREKSFVGVHDDVFARALVLDDGAQRVAFVTVEVTAIPNPAAIVAAVASAAAVPVRNVMVLATHTHSVPLVFYHNNEVTNPAQPREMQRIGDSAVAAVREAVAHLQPARIGWARGQAFVNANNGEEAGRKSWYDPSASSDKSLDVVRVTDLAGAPLAAMLSYASHAEIMFRSVTKDGGYEVTGDLPGATARLLETTPGGAPVVLYAAGAEGDQLPLFKSLQPAAELPESDAGAAGWGLLAAQARRLAGAALGTLRAMPPGSGDVRIAAVTGSATCPGQHFEVERPSGKLLGIKATPPVDIPLAAIRIGDFAIAGVGADIASDLGRAIKADSPVPHTTVVTMTAGAIGYVLNDAAYQHPGHGALGSAVKPGCASRALPAVVATLLRAQAK